MLRTIEVRRAKKTFINFEDETWTIPRVTNEEVLAGKRNMKKNRIHIIPLSSGFEESPRPYVKKVEIKICSSNSTESLYLNRFDFDHAGLVARHTIEFWIKPN